VVATVKVAITCAFGSILFDFFYYNYSSNYITKPYRKYYSRLINRLGIYSAKTLVCAHASQHHTIAILSPNSINHYITMQRSFGTEISGNRRPGAELLNIQRARILSAVESGEEKTEIATRYYVSRRVIYNTIDRWNNHHTLDSLLRPGAPKKLNRYQKRLLIRIVRRNPRIDYAALKCQVAGVTVKHKTLYCLLKKYYITNWRAKKRLKLTPAVA
jgi:transposase